jgi:hypothetical protein
MEIGKIMKIGKIKEISELSYTSVLQNTSIGNAKGAPHLFRLATNGTGLRTSTG